MRLSFSILLPLLFVPAPAAAQTIPPVVAGGAVAPDTPRAELLRLAREARKATVHPPRQTTLEKWSSRIEPFVMTPAAGRRAPRRGFYPQFGSVARGGGWAFGPGYRYEGLLGTMVDAKVSARASWKRYWQVEAGLDTPRLNAGRTNAGVFVRLRDLPQEDFSGFGIESAEEDRANFGLREFSTGAFLEQRAGEAFTLHAGVDFTRPSTRAGSDSAYPSIEERFETAALPGFVDEADFIVARGGATFDRTDEPRNPRRGTQGTVELSRWQARGGAPSTFNAFEADMRHYRPFFNETRVVVLRGAVWHTQPADGAEVPLYYQPVLGGSHALRGYPEFRFRDRSALVLQAEYRYQILPGIDAALFYEAGTVGRSLGDLGALKSDYGAGIRIGTGKGVFFRVDCAFGTPESPRLHIKLSDAF